jgi:uracil-DNA glycosylase
MATRRRPCRRGAGGRLCAVSAAAQGVPVGRAGGRERMMVVRGARRASLSHDRRSDDGDELDGRAVRTRIPLAANVAARRAGLQGLPAVRRHHARRVRHFKHEDRGRRRLHKKPDTAELEACRPWIDAELRAVEGRVIVALGATAVRSLFGRTMAIAASRGKTLRVGDRPAIVTYHPSAVLRADEAAAEIRAALVADLRLAHRLAVADA